MMKRGILILVSIILIGIFLSIQLKKYVVKQAEALEIEATNEWLKFINEITHFKGDLDQTFSDSLFSNYNYMVKFNLNLVEKTGSTIAFENECFKFNKSFMLVEQQLKDHQNYSEINQLNHQLNSLNKQIKKYNLACKRHKIFVRTLPNFYFIDEDKRHYLSYFSIIFNRENLNPNLYKTRFDKYMETGHDRFLKSNND